MDRSGLPETAFIAPDGSNRPDVEALMGRVLAQVLDAALGAAARSPLPVVAALPVSAAIPETGRPEDALLADLDAVLAQSMNPAHPGYIGHMDSIPATMSVAGALAAAILNNNMLSLEMAPVLSRLEVALMDEFAALFGLGPTAAGVMASGGSLANLQALTVARDRARESAGLGPSDGAHEAAVFASERAHTSIAKAARVLGLGPDAVVPVAVDRDGRMDSGALGAALDEAEAQGRLAVAVVATAGTTVTGAIDPLSAIAAIAGRRNIWLHVDAAYGGALAFSAREGAKLDGIAAADSITFNPQKWLYVAKTCACVLFRDGPGFQRLFRIGAPYMADSGGFVNLGELSLQGTRPAEVLKLWLTLQHIGRQGFASLIDGAVDLAGALAAELARRPRVDLAAAPDTNIVCFRPKDGTDAETEALQARLLREADLFLSLPLLDGRRWLRAVLLNPFTGRAEIARLLKHLDQFIDP